MRSLKIAIVGASGLVGEMILKILDEENLFENNIICLYVSKRSAGKEYLYKGNIFRFVELNENALKQNFDIVFFSAGASVSKLWAKKFVEAGSFVIDNTSAFRKEKNIPLVVPEINSDVLSVDKKLIANPNCSTIELTVVIDKLRKLSKIKKIVVSTYQSVSGAGRLALLDLKNNAKNVFKYGINDNIIPKIGEICENRYTEEENKMMFELPKILAEDIKVLASAVRIPVSVCHGESVYVEFEERVCFDEIEDVVECDYIKYSNEDVFNLSDIKGTNQTYVCRLRQFSKNEIQFFVIADNLRRGAAYNAVKIAKHIIEKFLK